MEIIPGINVSKSKKNPTLDSNDSIYELPFYKDAEFFYNLDNYVFYIKGIEKLIRRSKYYKRYISYLKKDLGLNFCQVKGNIQENEDDKLELIEMHHGPILTLFDYVAIVLEYHLVHNLPISTFAIANAVIEEHYNLNVQTVMLCETVHQEVHDNKIFINMKQGFGNLNVFLEKYRDGLLPEQIVKINKYIELSKQFDSYDNDTMKINDQVTKWSKEMGIDDWFSY
jgi:hypothetical protein